MMSFITTFLDSVCFQISLPIFGLSVTNLFLVFAVRKFDKRLEHAEGLVIHLLMKHYIDEAYAEKPMQDAES